MRRASSFCRASAAIVAVVFAPSIARADPPQPDPSPPPAPTDPNVQVIEVRGAGWSSPRGLGDVRIRRELLDAAPHQQTSEMLSAAPGFFVDHEDGEGFGNDVYLRGFDLDHGSGIEMRVGSVPINIPTHIQGQGYADASFIIPEVVRSIRVLGGPFDPRQGDAAIVGSAYFDLGVDERGYRLKTTYGSFNQARVVGVIAPEGSDPDTFAAFSLRKTDGFGQNRAGVSGSVNAQYGFDLGLRNHVRVLATAYSASFDLPGVVRQDDLDAGRIGFYDSYPNHTQGQGVRSSRVIGGVTFDHVAVDGARFEIAPWIMWTNFRGRQNYSGNIYSSISNPSLAGLGDLWETTNIETAAGFTSRFHTAAAHVTPWLDVALEPGVTARVGHTDQTKSLLDPKTLAPWDRRVDDGLSTFDTGAYLDLDLRFAKRLRISGGARADLLSVTVDDRLAGSIPSPFGPPSATIGATRTAQGIAAGPRVTAAFDVTPDVTPVVSYGEGFRSLDASANAGASGAPLTGGQPGLQEGSTPYSKVRSVEGGVRVQAFKQRYVATLSAFETHVANEVVFEATSGGLTTEGASVRRGLVGSLVAKPVDWLLVSTAASLTSATFETLVAGLSKYVPNVPPLLFRVDATARRTLTTIRGRPLSGRIGAGYTYLAPRHLTDTIYGPSNNVLNANVALRYGGVEIGVDGYNLFALKYADDREVYVSNFSVASGTHLASTATHVVAAPPLTVLGTLALYF